MSILPEPPIHNSPLRAFFLLRSLNLGGAQRQLSLLLQHLDPAVLRPALGVFYDQGELAGQVKGLDYLEYRDLAKQGRGDLAGFALRLARALKKSRAQVLYTWLTDPNLLGLAAAKLARVPIVWGLRASSSGMLAHGPLGRAEALALKLQRRLAPLADLVICNSRTGLAESQLPQKANTLVIPNGIDTRRFGPDGARRAAWRQRLGLNDHDIALGLLARDDAVKGVDIFLAAVKELAPRHAQARFILAGPGLGPEGGAARRVAELGLDGRVLLLGPQADAPGFYNCLDIYVQSSLSESFPNVLGEAMACARLCVATRVGDSPEILGRCGLTCPPGNAADLAGAMDRALRMEPGERAQLGSQARQRIRQRYSPQTMALATTEALLKVAKR